MKFKSLFIQEYLPVVLILAIVISSIVAHFGSVLAAMIAGFIVSMVATRFIFDNMWWSESYRQFSTIKKYVYASLAAIIGSQFAWVACLI